VPDNALTPLAEAIARVRARIAAAARRAGRGPDEITLVAVTKTFPVDTLLQAYQLGLRDLGENRVEEAEEKISDFRFKISDYRPATNDERPISNLQSPPSVLCPPPSDLRFHMIGHLQSRKAREAVALFDVIHSVDSVRLAQKLSRLCVEAGRVLPVLLECNVSGEESKYGFASLADAEVEAIVALPGVRVEGLMTMAPMVNDPQQARPIFAALRQMAEHLSARFGAERFRHLSMGMTDDFEVAIEEGATIVRIGRALFGERHDECALAS
jgi:pyridoxal phosphate enzyme (YggS family)